MRRILCTLLVLSIVAGCSGVAENENVMTPVTIAPTSKPSDEACRVKGKAPSDGKKGSDAVFIQQGELFGVNLGSRLVQVLVPRQGDTDFHTESVLFSGDGEGLVIHRDKEGRDSWWAASQDGSNLRRLQLPVDRQIRQVVRLCQTEFVGVHEDGGFVRFNLRGDYVYWKPEGEDRLLPGTSVVGSPASHAMAYVSSSGIVILGPSRDSLTITQRGKGKEIHGWLGDEALVTGDENAFYVVELSSGETRAVDYRSVFGEGSGVTTVSAHPKGQLLYVVRRSSIPSGSRKIVAVDPITLRPLEALPNKVPPASKDAPRFSPLGTYQVWPVEGPKELPYASTVAILEVATGEVLHILDAGMVSVVYAFHPHDEGFVFTDLSRRGTVLVYQDKSGQRFDLKESLEGAPIRGFEWNPRAVGVPER